MQSNIIKFCENFKFEELSEDFLTEIVRVNALGIYQRTKNSNEIYNWELGEKLAGFAIIDCYRQECIEKEECTDIPHYCDRYLEKISIQDAKQLKAYFNWECMGKNYNNSPENMKDDYIKACAQLIAFCKAAQNKEKECKFYTDILSIIDRRVNVLDRRLKAINKTSYKKRMGEKDRRKANDYRRLFLQM